jgi:hypothetical protein
MMKKALTILLAPALLVAVPLQAQTPAAPANDDLDCTVLTMKVLAGTLRELKKTDLSEKEREGSIRVRSRSERALAYFIGRLELGPKSPDFNSEISARWTAKSALNIEQQTDQTMECLARADKAQLDFLKSAGAK